MDRTDRVSNRLLTVMAVATGAIVANLYYAQPLLHTVAHALHTGSGEAGLIVTASQIGYAVGLAFLVPVGDIVSRRRLAPAVLLLTAVAMPVSAAAPGITVLIAVAVVVGLGSVAAQILVPFAASLASDDNRDRTPVTSSRSNRSSGFPRQGTQPQSKRASDELSRHSGELGSNE